MKLENDDNAKCEKIIENDYETLWKYGLKQKKSTINYLYASDASKNYHKDYSRWFFCLL